MIPWHLDRPAWVMRALSRFSRPTVAASGFARCACGCGRRIASNEFGRKREYFDHACKQRAAWHRNHPRKGKR